jgi:hypothetical protein
LRIKVGEHERERDHDDAAANEPKEGRAAALALAASSCALDDLLLRLGAVGLRFGL